MAQGPNAILEKNYRADGAVTEYRIVKPGTNEDDVAMATGVSENFIGVAQHTVADNERVRVMEIGISKVEYGGTVAYGDPLTSDANGRAVVAAPAAGANNSIIGYARAAGVLGDIGRVLLSPGRIQG